jgi:holliday junction DNA helicase RuvA
VIGWLRGQLLARTVEGEVIVEAGGVGYRVGVPAPLLARIGEPGDEVALHVHTHVREDAIVLYGFSTIEERRCFESLLAAHGVGPSLALAVLSLLTPADLVRAVLDEDVGVLCEVPGVGRKTAARLVIDLRSRLDLPMADGSGVPGGESGEPNPRADARSALVELGYGPDEIRRALQHVAADDTAEHQLRGALHELAGAR